MGNSGETLVELLTAMLILSLAALILAGAICSAARVNRRAERTLDPRPAAFGQPELSDSFIQLQDADGKIIAEVPVIMTQESAGDFRYE